MAKSIVKSLACRSVACRLRIPMGPCIQHHCRHRSKSRCFRWTKLFVGIETQMTGGKVRGRKSTSLGLGKRPCIQVKGASSWSLLKWNQRTWRRSLHSTCETFSGGIRCEAALCRARSSLSYLGGWCFHQETSQSKDRDPRLPSLT